VGKYLLEQLAEFPPVVQYAWNSLYRLPNTLVIGVLSLEKARWQHDNGKTASVQISCINISHIYWALPI